MTIWPEPDQEQIDRFLKVAQSGFVKGLLEIYDIYGPNILEKTDKFGSTALMRAASMGTPQMLQTLIDLGANVNAKNGHALIYATINGSDENIAILIKHGINKDVRCPRYGEGSKEPDHKSFTAYHFACHNGKMDRAKKLHECGVDILAVDDLGRTGAQYMMQYIQDSYAGQVPLDYKRMEAMLPVVIQMEKNEAWKRFEKKVTSPGHKLSGLPQINTSRRGFKL